jgi:hypothetical protein
VNTEGELELEGFYTSDWDINMGFAEDLEIDLGEPEEKLPSREEYDNMLLSVEHQPTIPVLLSLSEYDLMLIGKKKG